MALALPVLLILFLGMVELAVVIRAQLVLTNANREAARYASRGTVADQQVAERALASFAGQLPAKTSGPDANTGIIISRFYVPAGEGEPSYDAPIYVTGTLKYTNFRNEVQETPSKIDPDRYVQDLKTQNAGFFTSNDTVVVETYYQHHQILHAPVVQYIFPDPIVLYVRTAMRISKPIRPE
jgi:hypothetical protein